MSLPIVESYDHKNTEMSRMETSDSLHFLESPGEVFEKH